MVQAKREPSVEHSPALGAALVKTGECVHERGDVRQRYAIVLGSDAPHPASAGLRRPGSLAAVDEHQHLQRHPDQMPTRRSTLSVGSLD